MLYATGQQLADALKGNSSLTSLDMGGNNIGPEGITVVLNALRGNDTLETLELSYNPIGDKGAKALSDVLKYDVKVRL
jgi:NLR family CARD domain-containing protein 3